MAQACSPEKTMCDEQLVAQIGSKETTWVREVLGISEIREADDPGLTLAPLP